MVALHQVESWVVEQMYQEEKQTVHPGCVHQLLVCQGAPPLTALD
jgi:hypothetical protein